MSITFNGTTSIISNQTADVLNSSTILSFGAWIYATGRGENNLGYVFILDEAAGNARWLLHHADADNSMSIVKAQGPAGTAGSWTFPAADNRWNRVAVKHNWATDAAPTVEVNGSSVTVTEGQAPVGIQDTPATGYAVGNRLNDSARTWAGRIARVTAWNTDVSFTDINNSLLTGNPFSAGLRLYLRMADAADVLDRSGNAFDGTPANVTDGLDDMPIPRGGYRSPLFLDFPGLAGL